MIRQNSRNSQPYLLAKTQKYCEVTAQGGRFMCLIITLKKVGYKMDRVGSVEGRASRSNDPYLSCCYPLLNLKTKYQCVEFLADTA